MSIDYGSNNVATSGNISISGIVTATSGSLNNLLITGSGLITGDLAISGVLNPVGFKENLVSIGNTGASTTLSLASGTTQTATLSATCTFTMPSLSAGRSFTLFLTQGSGYTATFTSVKWPNNVGPAISASGKIDILSFISDGTYWYGSAVQNY